MREMKYSSFSIQTFLQPHIDALLVTSNVPEVTVLKNVLFVTSSTTVSMERMKPIVVSILGWLT